LGSRSRFQKYHLHYEQMSQVFISESWLFDFSLHHFPLSLG